MAQTTGVSPSQTALSPSDLEKKALCDYVVNVAEGCRHSCAFCYVPSTPAIRCDPGGKFADAGIDDPSADWGEYVLYREDCPANLRDDVERELDRWTVSDRGQGVVGISFGTDCYMDARVAAITRECVEILTLRDDEMRDRLGIDGAEADRLARPVRILTRNPKLAWDLDGDLYYDLGEKRLVSVGTSIPSLNEAEVSAIEPGAPSIHARMMGLERFANSPAPVFVSMSPTYPTLRPADLRWMLEAFAEYDPDVVFHEPINPRGSNIQGCIEAAHNAGERALQHALEAITVRSAWRDYAIEQLQAVQRLGSEVGVPVHPWPDDRLLPDVEAGEAVDPDPDEAWCLAWRRRSSPERVGFGDPNLDAYPEVPERARQQGLDAFEREVSSLDDLASDGWETVIEREDRGSNRVWEEFGVEEEDLA